jgi:hypothetical protein
MKVLKALRFVLLAILVLVIAALVLIDIFGDRAVKMGIEAAATKTLNVGVSIDEVDLSIMGGKLGIENLSINNPAGYQHEKLLELKDGEIQVEVRSLLSDVVKIREIKLDGVKLVLEQKGLTNNLQEIIKTVSARSKAKDESKEAGKKLHIDNLEITNVEVKVKLLPVPGKIDTIGLKLSPIKMTDLGSDNKLDTAALTGKILLALADGVARQGVGVLPKEILDPMKKTLEATLDIGKAATKEGGKIIEAGKDVGKGIVEGLKGLLTPKKEE